MKKVLLVLALVVAYGVSISNASTKVITVEKSNITVVADSDDFTMAIEEEEKDKKKDKKKATGEKPSTGCSDAQKKSCAASGKTCGDAKATTEKAACGDAKATTTATTTKACCGTKK